ncbi:hypothetical protein LTR66_012224 [Elasticomyces elasticus]|nr:hypothetical protein LTR66_012224 [Elasticomyces elasticus]KAK4978429.1 hypothetical protein LTR28_005633 [Elasticomyces elasticus]
MFSAPTYYPAAVTENSMEAATTNAPRGDSMLASETIQQQNIRDDRQQGERKQRSPLQTERFVRSSGMTTQQLGTTQGGLFAQAGQASTTGATEDPTEEVASQHSRRKLEMIVDSDLDDAPHVKRQRQNAVLETSDSPLADVQQGHALGSVQKWENLSVYDPRLNGPGSDTSAQMSVPVRTSMDAQPELSFEKHPAKLLTKRLLTGGPENGNPLEDEHERRKVWLFQRADEYLHRYHPLAGQGKTDPRSWEDILRSARSRGVPDGN